MCTYYIFRTNVQTPTDRRGVKSRCSLFGKEPWTIISLIQFCSSYAELNEKKLPPSKPKTQSFFEKNCWPTPALSRRPTTTATTGQLLINISNLRKRLMTGNDAKSHQNEAECRQMIVVGWKDLNAERKSCFRMPQNH